MNEGLKQPDPLIGEWVMESYYDARDERRVDGTRLAGGVWKMWREAPEFNQRFTGRISDDGKTVVGQWEMSRDGTNWEVDFDLTYTKVHD